MAAAHIIDLITVGITHIEDFPLQNIQRQVFVMKSVSEG